MTIYIVKSLDGRTQWDWHPDTLQLVVLDPNGIRWGYTALSNERLLDLLLEHEAEIRIETARDKERNLIAPVIGNSPGEAAP